MGCGVLKHETNRKQGAARNTGLDAAKGRYVLFVDSDDYLRIDALELMLNLIGDREVAVCQHILTRFDKPYKPETSNRHVKTTLRLAALENSIGWWPFGMLISRDFLERNRIRFREGVSFEDIDFNIVVFLAAESHVVTKEALYYYIQRDGSTVNSIDDKKLADAAATIAQVAALLPNAVPTEERQAFYKKASSWLQLQARRIRDYGGGEAERFRLAGVLVKELETAGLLKQLSGDLEKRIIDIVSKSATSPAAVETSAPADFRYTPWSRDFVDEFAQKVIFFCEVNYHIRSVAPIVRNLKLNGIESIIIDASRSTSFTSNRPLPEEELPLYSDVDLRPFNVAETLPFATDAAAFVFMNDLTYTKRLIFENFGFGVPTFGFYEGINDDWNLDRVSLRMPYRSVDHLLLPGIYQQGFYRDRECRIVGLPNVRSRLALPYAPPTRRRAIINVNFTYGVLEDRRDAYVDSAVQACQEIGLDYVITQHPADKADLSRYNVGRNSVYDLLDEGSLLVSRFSTTILEALAIGRPVVYHNPIGEKVPKFTQPLGAYSVSDSVDSLKAALQRELNFVDRGGDIRKRAALFLHFHCHSAALEEPAELAARVISDVIAHPQKRFAFKTGQVYRRVPGLGVALPVPDRQGAVAAQARMLPKVTGGGTAESWDRTIEALTGALTARAESPARGEAPATTQPPHAASDPADYLRDVATRLLLDPEPLLAQLSDAATHETMAAARNALAVDDPIRVHFERVWALVTRPRQPAVPAAAPDGRSAALSTPA
jgi:hypothetical protein